MNQSRNSRHGLSVVSAARRRPAITLYSRSILGVLVAVSLVGNALGYLFYFDVVWSYDKIMHFYTSFVVVLLLAALLRSSLLLHLHPHPLLLMATLTAFGVTLGFLWEVAEWVVDVRGYPLIIKGKSDTMIDMILDGLGAALAAGLVARRLS